MPDQAQSHARLKIDELGQTIEFEREGMMRNAALLAAFAVLAEQKLGVDSG